MGTGPDFQVDIRRRNTKIIKKRLRHFFVIMLPGVDEHMLNYITGPFPVPGLLIMCIDGSCDRCNFHKIRPGTCNGH